MSNLSASFVCLRARDVAKKLAISEATVWRHVQTHADFPKPIKQGLKTTVWLEHEVDAYISHLVEKSRTSEATTA